MTMQPIAASAPSVNIIQQLARTGRRPRNPVHSWNIRAKPWTIQPICIAPVVPGETLKNAMYQARVVTDPIKNPLIGWWTEYFWFYVKLRDLDGRDTFTAAFLDADNNMSALNSAAKVDTYHYASALDFAQMCLERVTKEYFRDEGEAYDAGGPGVISGMPIAKAMPPKSHWLDSGMLDTNTGSTDVFQDPHYDVQIAAYQAQYDRMRAMRMIDMTFDEFLGTWGVSVRQDEQQHIPELLRYHREWTYPANTVEPTTGVPSSAASWAVSDRLDKDRFFREPGFIFGVTIARPKIFLSNQRGAGVHMLDDPEAWGLPILGDQPWTTLRKFVSTAGPLSNQGASPANDYWIDVRDLFTYGDQFVNFDLAATDAGLVPLPKAGMQKAYIADADRTALFADAVTKNLVRQDGRIDFSIMGPPQTTVDHT